MQLKGTLAAVLVGLGLFLAAKPAVAHHAFAATFDTSKPVTVKGAITKVELINPHSWFWMDVTQPDGTVVNWGFEGGSPNSLIRHGVTKDTIPVGTVLIVQGYQSKAFDHKGVGVNMTLADGRKFLFGGSAPGAESAAGLPTKDEAKPTEDEKK
jgi:Family of unknown function (DUF6152)